MSKPNPPDPLDFFGHLKWIDGRPLPELIEPYRAQIFRDVLFTFDDDGRPKYSLALMGRAKKNWKSADLVLASLYRFLAWRSPQGSDVFILANDEGQAGDDLKLAKLLIRANPVLAREVEVQTKELVRTDGAGSLKILPARDVAGSHGKTYSMVAFDEIHAYKNWDLFEALAPDPTRHDALTWVTSYASIYNSPGFPLYDMLAAARKGEDARMFFSWYSGDDSTTDPEFASLEPEERANPSLASWDNPGYLAQQRLRLPTHRFRRLHLKTYRARRMGRSWTPAPCWSASWRAAGSSRRRTAASTSGSSICRAAVPTTRCLPSRIKTPAASGACWICW